MSLINDALRDLSAREHAGCNNAPETLVRSVAPINRFRYGMVFTIICAGVLAAAGFRLYQHYNHPIIAEKEKPAQWVMPLRVPETPTLTQKTSPKAAILVDAVVNTDRKETPDDVPNENVQRLLQKATVALQRDRLSLPADDNALAYYRKIQSLVPGSEDAEKGVAAVLSRYENLLSQAYVANDARRMGYLLTRIERAGLAFSKKIVFENQRAEIDAYARYSPAGVEKQPLPVGITKTILSLDSEAVQRARKTVALGDTRLAIMQLSALVDQYTGAHLSRLMLFDLSLQSGDIVLAKRMAASPGSDVISTYLQAKLRVHSGDLDTALDTLLGYSLAQLMQSASAEKLPATVTRDYSALCAALLQKKSDHQQALRYYRVLLQSSVNNAQYWLGYALSNDALNEQQKALSAYRKVIALGIEDSSSLAYVHQREKHLASVVLPKTLTEASITP